MDLARNWRLKGARYRLEGTRCEACDTTHFPARKICPACRSRQLSPMRFIGHGHVYSYTTLHQAPAGFATPYVVALVQLAEGPLITTQLTDVDPATVYIGMPVVMVTRKISEQGEKGLIVYGYKFRPPLPVYTQGENQAMLSNDQIGKERFIPMQPRLEPMAISAGVHLAG